MSSDEELKKIEEKLYSPEGGGPPPERHQFSPPPVAPKTFFDSTKLEQDSSQKFIPPISENHMKLAIKIFAGCALFFIAALGVAYYFVSSGTKTVSSDNIDINVAGPVSIKGGEDLSLQITITNRNSVSLEVADLLVEYPPGTRLAGEEERDLLRERISLGIIKPNESVSKAVHAILFGEENVEKIIKIGLEYRSTGSSATFSKDSEFKLLLSSSPISIDFKLPERANPGQEIELSVRALSNAKDNLTNVLLDLSYPPGFSFKSSEPVASFLDHIWRLGDIAPGKARTIRIRGMMSGYVNEVKSFRAVLGAAKAGDDFKVGVPYGTSFRTLSLEQPEISAVIVLNGNKSGDYISRGAEPIDGEIDITNNSNERVRNVSAELALGILVPKESVSVSSGFYDSLLGKIKWDQNSFGDLSEIAPGDTVRLLFGFDGPALAPAPGTVIKAPRLGLSATVNGSRVSPLSGSSAVELSIDRAILFSTDFDLAYKALYASGPLLNRGPLPPQAEKETTYTIVWTVSNSSNLITGAEVSTILPPYMQWLASYTPSNENISYDPANRTVRWVLGDVKAGSGFTRAAREIAFQLAIVPSVSQVDMEPNLTGEIRLSGVDQFTGAPIESIKRSLTTAITSDPKFESGQERVVR